uniref:Response regulator n=1 Tax=Roseihalotalea indica TaxID=2867963 RepID=A0AA49GIZ5_9BACT|nr:response regulator [Tunicatimonas sp. TK19036]
MKKVLVLDDDRLIRNFIKFKLENLDYSVYLFENPKELFDSQLLDSSDLLLLDINLENANGTDVLKTIKSDQSYKNIPVIMITGDEDDYTMEKCFRAGAYDYITKPFSEIALRSRMDSAINQFRKLNNLGEEILQLRTESVSLNDENHLYEKKIQNLEMFHRELSETTQHLAAATWRERKSKEELNSTLTELKITKEKVEESKKKIVASINYAQKIQTAFLPTPETLKSLFPEHFVLYQPKDIVSGDFYWCWSNERYKLIGVFDCTGHGVPGAFVSLIGLNLLKETVELRGIFQVDQILKNLDIGITQLLNQNTTENHDGMDAAIICIDNQTKKLSFSGAHNPLLYFRDDECIIIKGSKISIGGNRKSSKKTIELHEISLEGISEMYLFSDGLQDQFGGEHRKKLGIKNLTQFITRIHKEPMHTQKEKLNNLLHEWMNFDGTVERQIDDISFLGIRPNTGTDAP